MVVRHNRQELFFLVSSVEFIVEIYFYFYFTHQKHNGPYTERVNVGTYELTLDTELEAGIVM